MAKPPQQIKNWMQVLTTFTISDSNEDLTHGRLIRQKPRITNFNSTNTETQIAFTGCHGVGFC